VKQGTSGLQASRMLAYALDNVRCLTRALPSCAHARLPSGRTARVAKCAGGKTATALAAVRAGQKEVLIASYGTLT
jgi:hypothetical protein